jgi:hypothetical protein
MPGLHDDAGGHLLHTQTTLKSVEKPPSQQLEAFTRRISRYYLFSYLQLVTASGGENVSSVPK